MTCCHVSFAVNASKLLKKLNPDFFIALCKLGCELKRVRT